MRARSETIEKLLNPGVVAVIRTDHPEQIFPVCEALLAGGVLALELTMTIPHVLEHFPEAKRRYGTQATLGVGSVINGPTCLAAIEAGAEFIVSPITKPEIAHVARAANRPVMLGAYTPTEAQAAFETGADFIKIFPADGLGAGYIKSLHMLLPHLQIIPTGGVDLQTATDFVKAGCAAVGVGSSLVSSKLIRDQNWGELTRLAAEYVRVVSEARKK